MSMLWVATIALSIGYLVGALTVFLVTRPNSAVEALRRGIAEMVEQREDLATDSEGDQPENALGPDFSISCVCLPDRRRDRLEHALLLVIAETHESVEAHGAHMVESGGTCAPCCADAAASAEEDLYEWENLLMELRAAPKLDLVFKEVAIPIEWEGEKSAAVGAMT